jgi:hypothetical protein
VILPVFKTGGRQVSCRRCVRLAHASAKVEFPRRLGISAACSRRSLTLGLTPARRLNFKTGGRHLRCRRCVRLAHASAKQRVAPLVVRSVRHGVSRWWPLNPNSMSEPISSHQSRFLLEHAFRPARCTIGRACFRLLLLILDAATLFSGWVVTEKCPL